MKADELKMLADCLSLGSEGRQKLARAELIPLVTKDLGLCVEYQIKGPKRQDNADALLWSIRNMPHMLTLVEGLIQIIMRSEPK